MSNSLVSFELILNASVNNFSVMFGRVFLDLTNTKQRLMCLAEGHNAVTPVRTNNLDTGQARRSVWPESVAKLHKLSTDNTKRYIR